MQITKTKIRNFDPLDFFLSLEAKNTCVIRHENWITVTWNPAKISHYKNNPFPALKKHQIKQKKSQNIHKLPFVGGIIGSFSYNLGNKLLKIELQNKSMPLAESLPLATLMHVNNFLCYDKESKNIFFPTRLKQQILSTNQKKITANAPPALKFKPTITEKKYNQLFSKIKKYILEGHIYQVNLTYQLEAEYLKNPKELFYHLYKKNPALFSAYIDAGKYRLLSLSPERFIKVEGRKVTTTPIKGTIPLLEDPKTLLNSPKEKAELNMITDLLRNDLGKVCEIGSVKVTKNRQLIKAGPVWHTYTEITGKLPRQKNAADVIESCFPGGSITGCPKKRAMEIIKELEVTDRNFYTGVVASFSNCGNMDSSIIIRTILHNKNRLSLGIGGGIVYDSICKKEYEETLHKAENFIRGI
jgi:para-aminobenzoate synthetase component I